MIPAFSILVLVVIALCLAKLFLPSLRSGYRWRQRLRDLRAQRDYSVARDRERGRA